MGGSEITMAAQYGNKHGTLSIEPVSTRYINENDPKSLKIIILLSYLISRMVHQEVWEDFKEELAKVWTSYKDFDGTPLNTRFVETRK